MMAEKDAAVDEYKRREKASYGRPFLFLPYSFPVLPTVLLRVAVVYI